MNQHFEQERIETQKRLRQQFEENRCHKFSEFPVAIKLKLLYLIIAILIVIVVFIFLPIPLFARIMVPLILSYFIFNYAFSTFQIFKNRNYDSVTATIKEIKEGVVSKVFLPFKKIEVVCKSDDKAFSVLVTSAKRFKLDDRYIFYFSKTGEYITSCRIS